MTVAAPPDGFVPPPSAVHAVAPDGELFVWEVTPDIVAEKGSGLLSLPLAEELVQFYRAFLQPGTRIQVFIDFERITHYTREARDLLTVYSQAQLPHIGSLHMLLSSKNLALGVSAYKHDLGDPLVHTYAERASFLRSFATALRRRP